MATRSLRDAFAAGARLPGTFAADLIDRGARPNRERLGNSEQFAGIATALVGLFAFLDIVRRTLVELIGAPGVFVQLALIVVAIGGCAHIISARRSGATYRYGRIFRTAAKVLVLVLVLYAVPRNVAAVSEHFATVPDTFGGYLVDAGTGEPVDGARVRVVGARGATIGESSWPSDTGGFYIVTMERAARRSEAELAVHSDRCGSHTLPLTRDFERDRNSSTPLRAGRGGAVFRHAIECKVP